MRALREWTVRFWRGLRQASGDSGTSARVFSMIAAQMGDTRFRGQIIWMLLTSRPDLLPIDLKRQGRAEVHIPLFYPTKAEDIAQMLRMMAAIEPVRPDFVFLTGWEAALLPMLVIGCQGGTNATSGVVPEVMRKIFDLAKAGRIAEARPLQIQVIELFDAIVYGAEFPEAIRIGVELRGFNLGKSRQPQSEKQLVQRAVVRERICNILQSLGIAAE
jgi:4-hydroxy-tetrahydrodipicolinate synthase